MANSLSAMRMKSFFLLTADTDYKLNFNPDFKDPKTYVGPDPDQTTLAMLDAAAAKNYNELCERHKIGLYPTVWQSQTTTEPSCSYDLAISCRYRSSHPSTSGTLSQRKSGLPAGRNLLSVRTILINCQFTPRQSPANLQGNGGPTG